MAHLRPLSEFLIFVPCTDIKSKSLHALVISTVPKNNKQKELMRFLALYTTVILFLSYATVSFPPNYGFYLSNYEVK